MGDVADDEHLRFRETYRGEVDQLQLALQVPAEPQQHHAATSLSKQAQDRVRLANAAKPDAATVSPGLQSARQRFLDAVDDELIAAHRRPSLSRARPVR